MLQSMEPTDLHQCEALAALSLPVQPCLHLRLLQLQTSCFEEALLGQLEAKSHQRILTEYCKAETGFLGHTSRYCLSTLLQFSCTTQSCLMSFQYKHILHRVPWVMPEESRIYLWVLYTFLQEVVLLVEL